MVKRWNDGKLTTGELVQNSIIPLFLSNFPSFKTAIRLARPGFQQAVHHYYVNHLSVVEIPDPEESQKSSAFLKQFLTVGLMPVHETVPERAYQREGYRSQPELRDLRWFRHQLRQ